MYQNLSQKIKKTGNKYSSTTLFNPRSSMSTKLSQTPETFPQPSTPHIRLRIPTPPKNYKDGKPRKTNKKTTGNIQTQKPPPKQKPK